jgi:hypothetical protein
VASRYGTSLPSSVTGMDWFFRVPGGTIPFILRYLPVLIIDSISFVASTILKISGSSAGFLSTVSWKGWSQAKLVARKECGRKRESFLRALSMEPGPRFGDVRAEA